MLNKFNFLFFVFLTINFANSQVNPNEVFVRGYTRNDGTVVAPHYRTAPNNTNTDNFSTLPNINPHTLEPGYILPDSKQNIINTYVPDYPTYYPDQNERNANYSYEVEQLLEKINRQEYYNGTQNISSEIITHYDSNYDYNQYNIQNNIEDTYYNSIIDSRVAPVDSALLVNSPISSPYENPKIIIPENDKSDFATNYTKKDNDISSFAKICAFIFIILILRKITQAQ